MGLNLNSSLLLEGANEQFKIPVYKESYPALTLCESEVDRFNLEIAQAFREVNMKLFEVGEYERVSLNEGFIATAKQKIVEAIKSIKNIIIGVFKRILGWIGDLINKIKNFFTRFKRNPKLEQMPTAVYIQYLNKNCTGKEIQCADLTPTANLLSNDFPSNTVIGTELTDLVNTTVSGAIQNCWQSLDNDYHFEIIHNLDSTIETMREDLSKKIYGSYYGISNGKLNGDFVSEISKQAFGSTSIDTKEITEGLFLQAYQNIKTDKNLVDQVTRTYNETKGNCAKALNTLDDLNRRIDQLYNQVNPSGIDLNREQNAKINSIIPYMKRIVNTATEAIGAQTKLVSSKIMRINQIYCVYSQIVVNTCDNIVLKALKDETDVTAVPQKESYTDIEEGATYLDDFERAMFLIEDAYNEDCYNEVLNSLLEGDIKNAVNYAQNFNAKNANKSADQIVADSKNQQQSQKSDQPANQSQNQQQQSGNSKNAFIKWIDGVLESVRQLINKFLTMMKEKKIAPNANWWKQNKDKMAQIDYEKVKVSGWYNYNFKAILDQSSYVKWNPTDPMLNSDKDMQNAILKQFGITNPNQDNNTKFADKIKGAMRTLAVQNNQSVELGTVQGWNKQDAITFMDRFFTGGDGDAYKVINDDNKQLDNDRQNFKNNYDSILKQMSDNAAQQNQKQSSGEPAKTSTPTGGNGGTNNSSSWQDEDQLADDMAYGSHHGSSLRENSLVDIFGLSRKGISWLTEADNAAKPASGGTSGGGSAKPKFDTSGVQTTLTTKGFNKATKEVDAKMKRFISFNSMAITARLTVATEAFNQYIGLFKSI